MRSFYDKKFSSEDKIMKKDSRNFVKEIKPIYMKLSNLKRLIVNNLVKNLLPESSHEQLFGIYFTKCLELKNITTYEIAMLLNAKYQCEYALRNENYDLDIEDIRSKLENFKKISKPQDKSFELILDVCKLLSIDIELLKTGEGKVYSINYDVLDLIINEKKINTQSLFNKVACEALNCYKCSNNRSCEFKDNYIEYMILNEVKLAETIARILEIDSSALINEKYIFLELDEFPLEKYYIKLSKNEQKAVYKLIIDLHMKEFNEDM